MAMYVIVVNIFNTSLYQCHPPTIFIHSLDVFDVSENLEDSYPSVGTKDIAPTVRLCSGAS
jgi:hypothetical protein